MSNVLGLIYEVRTAWCSRETIHRLYSGIH